MDPKGFHGLFCRLNKGRLPKHAEINFIVKRCLGKIGLPSILEPTGLDRGDGRRPYAQKPFRESTESVWSGTSRSSTLSPSPILLPVL